MAADVAFSEALLHAERAPEARRWTRIALLLAALAILTRVQFLGNPLLDSDEGFYLLVGDRMLHGALPYIDLWDRKPIGLFLLYATMRLLGGDGVVAYQLVGTAFVFGTSLLVARMAREFSGMFGAAAAGAAYAIWLTLASAYGGQAELFLNLPVCAAAWLTMRALQQHDADKLWRNGALAMLLAGIAMQIKYTALFVGIFLGCCWLAAGWRAGKRAMLAAYAASWILAALAPTLAATAYFAARGGLHAFLFANFLSIWMRHPHPAGAVLQLAWISLILSPLAACIDRPPADREAELPAAVAYRFGLAWLGAAIVGLLALPPYFDQYMLPVIPPASMVAGRFFTRSPERHVLALLAAAFLVGQAKLAVTQAAHGTRRQLAAIVRDVDRSRCLYVYSGLSTFYRVSGACIPTRFAFPSLIARERESGSIGVDPVREVNRIMATRPGTVILRGPYRNDENWAARAALFRNLQQHYRLVLVERLGWHRIWVYRLAPSAPRIGARPGQIASTPRTLLPPRGGVSHPRPDRRVIDRTETHVRGENCIDGKNCAPTAHA